MPMDHSLPSTFSSLLFDGLTNSNAPLWIQGERNVSRKDAEQMVQSARQALREGDLCVADQIVVHADPTPESLTVLLAAMLEQLVVIPVDPTLTDARKAQILDLTNPQAIAEVSPTAMGTGLTRIDIAELFEGGRSNKGLIYDAPASEAEQCYIFFTSGSTGVPKPVLGRRSGLIHFITWERDMLKLDASDRVALLTRFSFDVVLRDILLPLVSGCTSVLPAPGCQLDGRAMVDWLSDQQITLLHTVPSVAHAMLAASENHAPIPTLRHTLFAGEPLNGSLVDRWRKRFPTTAVHNLYGPTETTLAKFHARVPVPALPGIQACGDALPETTVAIYAEDGSLQPEGTLGEVAIITPFASLGYYDLAEEGGIRNPQEERSGTLQYMTGDLGFLDTDGALHLRGRKDDQVKIMGVRLELAGISAAMEQHPKIDKSVVLVDTDDAGQKRLAAWYVPSQDAQPDQQELRAFLAGLLPPAGIPGLMIPCDSIPLMPNGKVDKKKLPRETSEYEPPAPGIETTIAEAFANILKAEHVGATSDYFALGGDSLAATSLSIDLSDKLGKPVEPGMLLDAPTPRSLARLLETQRNEGFTPFPPAPPQRSFDLTPQQQRYHRTFLAGGNRNWCNMVAVFDLPDHVTWNEVSIALHDISVHHDSLRLGFEVGADGTTRQLVRPNSTFQLGDIDLENLSPDEAATELARLKLDEAEKPIPVYSDATLFRASLLRLHGGGRKLLWNVHHLVSDGTSQGILHKSLLEWLTSSKTFRETYVDLPSFRDLAHAVNARANEQITSYFPSQLKTPNLYKHSYLPITQDVADPQRCHAFDATLAGGTMDAVRKRARKLKCTPYVVLLAGYFRTLSQLTGQTDMAIVTPLAGREHPQARELIADLINLVPHRVSDLNQLSDSELITRLRGLVTEAARHQDDQFDQVVDALGLPFPEDRNALTGFSLNYMPQTTQASPMARLHSDRGYKLKYDILFLMRDFRNCLNVEIQYRAGLFDAEGIESLFDLFETTLKEVCDDT